MKTAIVPAQVTTIEDKVTGNLTLAQLLILITPLCMCGVLYALFPLNFRFNDYKLVLISVISPIVWLFALRIRGKLIINWLAILARYTLRPRYFISDKNDLYLRESHAKLHKVTEVNKSKVEEKDGRSSMTRPSLDLADVAFLELVISEPQNSLSIKQKKEGGFNVVLKETK